MSFITDKTTKKLRFSALLTYHGNSSDSAKIEEIEFEYPSTKSFMEEVKPIVTEKWEFE